MTDVTLLDAGPLVAYLNSRDQYHAWADEQLDRLPVPFQTCEAVITEACFLLHGAPEGCATLTEMIEKRIISVTFRLAEEITAVGRLMAKYSDLPTSLADACLVRMSEQITGSIVLTLDSHFRIYRKHGRQVIPTLMPRGK